MIPCAHCHCEESSRSGVMDDGCMNCDDTHVLHHCHKEFVTPMAPVLIVRPVAHVTHHTSTFAFLDFPSVAPHTSCAAVPSTNDSSQSHNVSTLDNGTRLNCQATQRVECPESLHDGMCIVDGTGWDCPSIFCEILMHDILNAPVHHLQTACCPA